MPCFPLLLPLLLWGIGSHGFPAFSEVQQPDVEAVQKYLDIYHNPKNLKSEEMRVNQQRNRGSVVTKLKQMQKFFGLNVTGKPGAESLSAMAKPRCGVPDGPEGSPAGSTLWDQKDLTYRIENYTPYLAREVVDRSVEKAFELWSSVTSLKFTRVFEGEADLNIAFFSGDHYDNSPFDGPEGYLAHAFQPGPGLGGDIHFDNDEMWTDDYRDYNFFRVAVHEVGHALGLFHTNDIGSLMYPVYTYTGDVLPSEDDVNSIQALYGPPETPIKIRILKTPKMCDSDITFDAITTVRGDVMFFKNRFIMRVINNYPENEFTFISAFWPHLPSDLEAAYEFPYRDEVRFFKGSKYWAVRELEKLQGYPRDIYRSFGFSRNVTSIDAAVYDEIAEKTYFFVDDEYWRYDEFRQSMDAGYPKKINQGFHGIGNKVDAVFMKRGLFYFFHGASQYVYDPQMNGVLRIRRPNTWFMCEQK